MTDLDLRVFGDAVEVALDEVRRQPSGSAVIGLCASKSGLLDKVIAPHLGAQEAVWSRIKSGQNNLSLEQLDKLMDRCGNEAPLQWLLLRRGYDPRSLRKLESETERALRQAQEALESERNKVRVLTDALHGRVA